MAAARTNSTGERVQDGPPRINHCRKAQEVATNTASATRTSCPSGCLPPMNHGATRMTADKPQSVTASRNRAVAPSLSAGRRGPTLERW